MKMARAKLNVVQDEENPIPVEVLAKAVTDIAAGIKRLNSTPLNRRALVVLIAAQTSVARDTVSRVLDGLDQLEAAYIKKPQK